MRIVLNATELMVAAYIGSARNVQSVLGGAKPSAGMGMSNSWTANIEGAQGEMAVAKYLGRYWVPRVEHGRPKCFYVPRSALQALELLPFGEPA